MSTSSCACQTTPVSFYIVEFPCAGIVQVVSTPTDTSSSTSPYSSHTSVPITSFEKLCFVHKNQSPKDKLTPISSTGQGAVLNSDGCFIFIVDFVQ